MTEPALAEVYRETSNTCYRALIGGTTVISAAYALGRTTDGSSLNRVFQFEAQPEMAILLLSSEERGRLASAYAEVNLVDGAMRRDARDRYRVGLPTFETFPSMRVVLIITPEGQVVTAALVVKQSIYSSNGIPGNATYEMVIAQIEVHPEEGHNSDTIASLVTQALQTRMNHCLTMVRIFQDDDIADKGISS
jgi:hypothetical protein